MNDKYKRRVKILVNSEFLVNVLMGGCPLRSSGSAISWWKSDIPGDLEITGAEFDPDRGDLLFLCCSWEFAVIPDEADAPIRVVTMRSEYRKIAELAAEVECKTS